MAFSGDFGKRCWGERKKEQREKKGRTEDQGKGGAQE